MKIVNLNKQSYQSHLAEVAVEPAVAKQGDTITITGKNFSAFQKRGNPGVAVLFVEKPLTGIKINSNGTFKIKMKMPPFKAGEHTIDVFGVKTKVVVEADDEVIIQQQLKDFVLRDFNVDENAHLLFSDVRYRACPIEELECYLTKSDVPHKKYVSEWFDCDDFSDALHGQYTFDTYPKGYAHGEMWVDLGNGGGHAVNCWLVKKDGELKMVVVEPQTGRIFDFPSEWTAFMIKI